MPSNKIIIGQECICPDGLGRVSAVREGICQKVHITVDTYINTRNCEWDSHNVQLINPLKNARLSSSKELLEQYKESYERDKMLKHIEFLLHQVKLKDGFQDGGGIENIVSTYREAIQCLS